MNFITLNTHLKEEVDLPTGLQFRKVQLFMITQNYDPSMDFADSRLVGKSV